MLKSGSMVLSFFLFYIGPNRVLTNMENINNIQIKLNGKKKIQITINILVANLFNIVCIILFFSMHNLVLSGAYLLTSTTNKMESFLSFHLKGNKSVYFAVLAMPIYMISCI